VNAAIFGCLDPILIVVAGQSIKSPLLDPIGERSIARDARRRLTSDLISDHLALIRLYLDFEKAFSVSEETVNHKIIIFLFFLFYM
jgi:hypothetical protein